MNTRSVVFVLSAAFLLAPVSVFASELIGWASVEGHGLKTTTGGSEMVPITVSTLDELRRLLADEAPQVVVVSGKIATGPKALEFKSHKTLVGADKNATIHGGLNIKGASNIIVRNLNLQGAGVGHDPADAIAARESYHLWFDHLNVWDSRDGNLDLTIGCDCVTVSWCKFWYTDATNDHCLSCLVGGGSTHGDMDLGKNGLLIITTGSLNRWTSAFRESCLAKAMCSTTTTLVQATVTALASVPSPPCSPSKTTSRG